MLLVSHHSILRLIGYQNLAESSFLAQANEFMADVRMPLFTFLSGLVYAYLPVRKGQGLRGRFLKGKALRLLVPLAFVSSIFYFSRQLIPGVRDVAEPETLLQALFFSYTHFWYLQALFLIFVLIALLDARTNTDNPRRFAVAMLFSIAMYSFSHTLMSMTSFFSIGHAVYLLPFFMAGVGFLRFRRYLTPPMTVVIFAFLVVGLISRTLFEFDNRWISLLIGTCFAASVVASNLKMGLLGWIGTYSYSIYLYHSFGIAGGRLIMSGIGLNDGDLQFAVMLVAGVAFPIILHMLVSRFWLLSRPLLGLPFKADPVSRDQEKILPNAA